MSAEGSVWQPPPCSHPHGRRHSTHLRCQNLSGFKSQSRWGKSASIISVLPDGLSAKVEMDASQPVSCETELDDVKEARVPHSTSELSTSRVEINPVCLWLCSFQAHVVLCHKVYLLYQVIRTWPLMMNCTECIMFWIESLKMTIPCLMNPNSYGYFPILRVTSKVNTEI